MTGFDKAVMKRHPAPWRIADDTGSGENSYFCIRDASNEIVIGSSEWLNAGDGVLEAIVDIANNSEVD